MAGSSNMRGTLPDLPMMNHAAVGLGLLGVGDRARDLVAQGHARKRTIRRRVDFIGLCRIKLGSSKTILLGVCPGMYGSLNGLAGDRVDQVADFHSGDVDPKGLWSFGS